MTNTALDALTHAQRERLAFIDFNLQYFGQVARADLIQRFKTGLAACTRDFSSYKELAPQNLVLSHTTKSYHRLDSFKPLFEHNAESILSALCRGFGDGLSSGVQPSSYCQDATRLIHPNSETIATIMRAITSKLALECQYTSLTSGTTLKVLVPHSIVNNGTRWHVRAFDRTKQQFRDFVTTRIECPKILQSLIKPEESADKDTQWQTIYDIILTPHPKLKYPKAIELDYAMENGQLKLEIRAALLGYLLRQWNVDCTEQGTLNCNIYQLHLINKSQLNLKDIEIAPGYEN
ncbi:MULTISPECIES: WYL domain-containing protein [unclassified Pseudoalteromonas]|uniref:WYL domain-containing protein n=1 Tax=unclassified Pseudoalteromonas TaxID=194690 RepID=UPI0025B4CE57|nr:MULTISPECIES: WYL domain-containing protein [unclassified Pseudoalteromonas]MDN3395740.1 WYL domain-containing protein [Pseudoalteromonas sp. APC 3215]MDN3471841.1 WYL domain-containing protein [Pseudoalteromonas sp. APC 4026]